MTKYMIIDENEAILQDGFDTKEDAELQNNEWADSGEKYIGMNEPDDGLEKEINPHLVKEYEQELMDDEKEEFVSPHLNNARASIEDTFNLLDSLLKDKVINSEDYKNLEEYIKSELKAII